MTIMQNFLFCPWGQFQLSRLPKRDNDMLRAWDAADEYLLQHLASEQMPEQSNLLICNDGFGALAVALHKFRPISQSDSYLSHQATRLNLQQNGIHEQAVHYVDSLELPAGSIDYLLIKAPKNLGLLEYQLLRLRPLLNKNSKIIIAGMVKTLPTNVWKLLETLIGPTVTSLAVKKARLIFVKLDLGIQIPANRFPVCYSMEETGWKICNHANVFSRDSLDIGTRFLLQYLPEPNAYRRIIDLGCGNGVVGLMLAQQNPQAKITFVDESYMAIASAKDNCQRIFPDNGEMDFLVGDGLSGFQGNSYDCVVCNPPFHQQHTVGDYIAEQMFRQAYHVLQQGGELRVIGNRHLNYHLKLKGRFGNCAVVASNPKFVVYKSIK